MHILITLGLYRKGLTKPSAGHLGKGNLGGSGWACMRPSRTWEGLCPYNKVCGSRTQEVSDSHMRNICGALESTCHIHAVSQHRGALHPSHPRPPSYLNKLLRGGEAAHAERHEDPAPGIAALRWVVRELLADLAVNLVPKWGQYLRVTPNHPSAPQLL